MVVVAKKLKYLRYRFIELSIREATRGKGGLSQTSTALLRSIGDHRLDK
jgi:hypothetical protein